MPSFKRNRVVNTSLVLREIWRHRRISRVQIAKILDLDKSTVSSVVAELIEAGVILESAVGRASPQGGRRPVFLELNGSNGSVLGVELKPDGYSAVTVDLSGRILEAWSADVEIGEPNLGQAFLDAVSRVRSTRSAGPPLLGIGVGLPGIVDPERRVVRCSIPLGIAEAFDFRAQISGRCELPVYVENDANACAWAELSFHRTKPLENFIFVLLEFRDPARVRGLHERSALGLGIVVDGRVHHGRSFSAGEFRSVLRRPSDLGQFSLTDEESLRVTDEPALLARLVEELAKNVALLANALNADDVYLGGDIEGYGELVGPIFEREIQENWPYPDRAHCRVRFSSLGRQAVAYGGAGLVLHHLFADLGSMGRLDRSLPLLPEGMSEKFRSGTIGFQTMAENR